MACNSLSKFKKNTAFQLGDKRIDRRAEFMVTKMTKVSGKSLPQIFSSEKDLKGAYRFFSNNLVTPDKILAPHSEETVQRCQQEKVVLAIQDSSDLDFDYMECLEGFESLHTNVDKGFRIHPIFTATEKGTPLGILATLNYTRTPEKLSKKHRNSLPIEEKESYRWFLGYLEACKLATQLPDTEVISISDRESDIYESLIEATTENSNRKAHILLRGKHNRSLADADENVNKIQKKLIRCPLTYEAKLNLNKYTKDARTANIAVRACEVNLKAPQTCLKKSLSSFKVNALIVTEIDPPKGITPLHWLLITTLPIDTPEQIRRIVSLYSQRWGIEVYFKVLKSGCKIDSQRLQVANRIENYIALAMVVAWKVMLTTYLPREYPDVPCTVLFTNIEWKLAFRTVYEKGQPFPKTIPTLKEVVQLVAMMGGYQKRKQLPGIQTIWRGITRLMDIVIGFNMTQEIILSHNEDD